MFTNVLDHVDSPYLLSERIDPRTGEFYGNFPQAFSHIGLVNSAIYLRRASDGDSLVHDPLGEDKLRPLFRTSFRVEWAERTRRKRLGFKFCSPFLCGELRRTRTHGEGWRSRIRSTSDRRPSL
ncbi:glycoside hydrolase family 15 protein [Haloprofundus salinisoli]|uniref:glycoside hydrolase family 15 protein n=1 Tax=Haloprofundus salinisoli TaxID=2876193 RepID=UPI003CE4C408